MSPSTPSDLLTIARALSALSRQVAPGATRCWLCEGVAEPVAIDDAAAPPAASQVVPPERVGSYSLASLLMFITLVSVVLGVSTIALGIGIPLGVVLLVVWLRTAAVLHYRPRPRPIDFSSREVASLPRVIWRHVDADRSGRLCCHRSDCRRLFCLRRHGGRNKRWRRTDLNGDGGVVGCRAGNCDSGVLGVRQVVRQNDPPPLATRHR